MGRFGIISLYLFFLLFPGLLIGQTNYAVKTFTTENGIPHNHVYGIAQDQNGFLWLATFDGLSRWNGYEFRNYYHNPGDSTTISYFQTNDIFVDYQNNLWIQTSFGISKYNRSTDNFSRFRVGRLDGVDLDRYGKLWINSQNGLLRWNYQTNKFIKVQLEIDAKLEELSATQSLRIKFDNENRLWLIGISPDQYFFYRCDVQKNGGLKSEFIGSFNVTKYVIDRRDRYWRFEIFVSPEKDVFILSNIWNAKLDKKTKQFVPFSEFTPGANIDELHIQDIKKAKEVKEYFTPIIRDTKINSDVNPFHIETYLIDRQNILWQGILNSGASAIGLTRSIPTPQEFKHYFQEYNPQAGLNSFFPVLKDKFGTVWGGATNANKYFVKDKLGNDKQIVPLDQTTWEIALRPRSFFEDSTGIWVGYFGGVLLRYDFASQKFKTELLKKTDLTDRSLPHSVVHLKKDGNNLIIVGFKDIFRYRVNEKRFELLKQFSYDENINLYCIIRDSKAGWWVGASLSRLFYFSNDFKEMKTYIIGEEAFFNIEEVVEGDNNDLWVSMLGGGIARFDKATGESEIYTTADGLSNNTCYGMLKDRHGNLWISTNHGISRFNPKTKQFRIFQQEDGLKIDEFNSDNTYQSPDGEMFFSGMGGIVSFYPDSVDQGYISEKIAPLVIEDFMVSGTKRYFKKAVYESDTVSLDKGDDNFSANFACLDFRNAEKIKYRYKLEGEDDGFVQADYRHRFLNYANLLPGTYQLVIEATNINGEWASHRSWLIVVPAFYYQTWWFKAILVLLVCLLIGQLIFGYNRRIRLLARKKQDELKLESLRGQMNPHFIFNSLNSINYFISQNDRLSANRYIADFSRLIRSILGNTTSDYIPLQNELDSLRDYLQLEHLRFGDKFDYRIDLDSDLDTEALRVSPGMVQPFVENAIWHGVRGLENRKGFITISYSKSKVPGAIQCTVEDDGIGRKLSEQRKSTLPGKKSRGIAIILERQAIINDLRKSNLQISIDDLLSDREETGTRVVIDIPVK